MTRDQVQIDREIWTLILEHDRLDRHVGVIVTRAEWFDGWAIAVRTGATWEDGPTNSFSTSVERRWFGLTNRSPTTVLEDTLELALSDAKSYTTDELLPREEANRRARPW
jgi:hypothetical protein